MGLLTKSVSALLGPPPPSTMISSGLPYDSPMSANFQSFARNGYQGNAIIFAGIDLISTSASEPHIIGRRYRRNRRQVRAEARLMAAQGLPNRAGRRLIDAMLVKNGFWEEVDDHPLVKLLNNPNPYRSRGQLWGTVTMDYHLAGNAYVLKARYTEGLLKGAVGELWRLRPDRVRVIPSTTNYISGYEYGIGRDVVTFKPEDVMHFKTRNPLDDYYGMPPLMAVTGRMAIDQYMQRFLLDYYETGGTGPGAILSSKNTIEPADKDAIRDRMRRQFGVGGRMLDLMILDNADDLEYTPLALNRGLRDALPKEIDSVTEARLAMVLGLPGSILGLLIGYESSSYANKRQDWQVLWDVKMTPMLSDFDDVINLSMTPEFGGIDEVVFDLSDIRALQEDEDALQDRARKNFIAGGLSFQGFREKIGEPAEPDAGEMFFVPGNYVVTPTERLGEEPEELQTAPRLLERAVALMLPAGPGRPRLEDDPEARADYLKAQEFKAQFPTMTWAQIASRIGKSERQLRELRARFADADGLDDE